MNLEFMLMLISLGLIGGFFSGLLGIGGGIIMIPLLLFVPEALGFQSFDLKLVTGITMMQSLVGTFSGYLVHRKKRVIQKELIKWIGFPVVVASFSGAVISKSLTEEFVLGLFAFLILQAAVMMFLPKKPEGKFDLESITFNRKIAFAIGLTIGFLTGVLGLGGAFLLIPTMIYILRIPTRVSIGTSLAIAFLAAMAGFVGKWGTGQVPLMLALVLAIGTFVGANLGGRLSHKVSAKALQTALGVFFTGIAIRTWLNLLDILALSVVIKLFLISTGIAIGLLIFYKLYQDKQLLRNN